MSPRGVLGAMLLACVALSVLAGVAGGLLRVGIAVSGAGWAGRAAVSHAALMICGFMGTMIGVERAVAAKRAIAWLAPLASGLAGVSLLAGADALAAVLLLVAGVSFVVVNLQLLRRQSAPHTALLLASALAWLAGNLLFASAAASTAVLPWWFGFLVMTIAAERLEMTRLMRRRPGAQLSLYAVLLTLAAGAAASALWPAAGGVVFGFALLALAGWLSVFDLARRTVRAHGLTRYMAVCLLAGYAWLAIGGAAWIATALGAPARDVALHALGLGFLVSMVMGHAPVILPAIARIKLLFGGWFYVPLAALHLSLALRLGAGFADFHWRQLGALFNTLALALFAATVIGAALAWRRRHGGRTTTPRTP